MLEPTGNPRIFRVKLTNWNLRQPDVTTGTGTREELHCTLEFPGNGDLVIRYTQTQYLRRESPALAWKPTATVDTPETSHVRAIVEGAVLTELLAYLGRRVKWA